MSKKTTKTGKPVSKKASKSAAQAPVAAAPAEPEAVVTIAAPAAETTAAPVTAAPVAEKPAKVAKVKAPKAPRVEQNGVVRPKAGGACARVWQHLDENGDMTVKDIKAWATSEGLNPGNAAIEIYLWRKFSGIAKPVKPPKAARAKEVQRAA